MEIEKKIAQDLAYGLVGEEFGGFKIVENSIKSHSRWSVHFNLVVEKDGKYYKKSYSKGATEAQLEEAFEYETEKVKFAEVQKQEKTITVYE